MSLAESGKMFPNGRRLVPERVSLAKLVKTALETSLRDQSSPVKRVAAWTGANERTVKNWFAGSRAPSGDHFLGLAANSPAVLAAFLAAIHRNDCLVMVDLDEARSKVASALAALDAVREAQMADASSIG